MKRAHAVFDKVMPSVPDIIPKGLEPDIIKAEAWAIHVAEGKPVNVKDAAGCLLGFKFPETLRHSSAMTPKVSRTVEHIRLACFARATARDYSFYFRPRCLFFIFFE